MELKLRDLETLEHMQRAMAAEAHAHTLIIRMLLAAMLADKPEGEADILATTILASSKHLDGLAPMNDMSAELFSDIIVRAQERLAAHIADAQELSARTRAAMKAYRQGRSTDNQPPP